MNIFFTSDTHYSHSNLIKGTSRWSDTSACRPFKSIEEHNDCIVEGINKTVGENDILYHLGDWSFGGKHNIPEFAKRLKCKNIYLTIGNHDNTIEKNWQKMVLSVEDENYVKYFKGVSNYNILKFDGYPYITICHYAMRTWYYQNKGAWNLFGHSHDTLRPNGKQLDVGMDTAKRILGEYRPFSLEEIRDYMNAQKVVLEDHHTERTNPR